MKAYVLKLYSVLFGRNKRYLLNQSIINDGSYVKKNRFDISGKGNHICFGNNSRIESNNFVINGSNNRIVINNCSRIIDSKFWVEGDNNLIFIDDNFKASGPIIFAAMEGTKIEIGKDNLFSYDVEIRTSDGHSILDSNGDRINRARDVIIGDGNWIGKKVTFLKGSQIGNGNVVGYCSCVTKKFDVDNSVLLGIPASIKKQDISWSYDML